MPVFLWYLQESNQGHTDFQSVALPTELRYLQKPFAKAGANIISKLGYTNKNLKKGNGFFSILHLCTMNLVIDIGNTLIKYAVFENNKILFDEYSESGLFLSKVKELFELYPKIGHSLISSVGALQGKEQDIVSLFCRVHVLTSESKVPFKNSYATPQTLGMDRIAVATAAFYLNPRGNTLVIDAGTCITYDMVNDSGEYVGGAISPGVQMRYKAMHNQTAGLPLLRPDEILDFIGNSTETCMHSGVVNGVSLEIDGVISQYRSRFQDLTVILTGGDSHFFANRLKNTIFANSKFLLEGLNYLLEYNKR